MKRITVYEANDGSLWHCKNDAAARDEHTYTSTVDAANAAVLERALNAEDTAIPLLHTLQKMGYTLRRRPWLKRGDYLINGQRRSVYDPPGYRIVVGDGTVEDCKKCCFDSTKCDEPCINRPDGRSGYFVKR